MKNFIILALLVITSNIVFAEVTVTLTRLFCHETEDHTGSDECLLKVFRDGSKHGSKRRDMNNGDDWPLDWTITFDTKLEIELWDEDSGIFDEDDFLGKVTITKENAGGTNGNSDEFTLDGARYTIYWVEK